MRVLHAAFANALDDQTNGVLPAHGRVRNIAGEKINGALRQRDVVRAALVLDADIHRTLELKEEFLGRIDVIIGARIRPPDHRYHEVVLTEDRLGPERRFELVGVLGDPFHQVE
jgi:hypothetical protein